MGKILLKVHESYRWVVSVCDEDVFGRVLVDPIRHPIGQKSNGAGGSNGASGKRVLDVSGDFFRGDLLSEDEVREEVVRCNREDATFNFVGVKSVGIAKELGLVKEEGVVEIEGVPVALVLL